MQDETLTETLSLIDEETSLPKGWRSVRLGDVCEVVTGGTPPRSESRFYGDLIPWIKPDDLDRSVFVKKSAEYLSEEGGKISRLLPKGSVLVSCIGNIGKLAIAAKTLATNQQINSLIPSDKIDTSYLYYACKVIKPKLNSEASISLVSILNKSSFSNIKIPLPPTIEEQRRIASVLDEQMKAVEQARLAVEAQLKAANLLPNAFLRVVFESEEAQNWQKRKLGDYAKVQSGYAFKTDWYVKDGIRLLRNANVFQGFIDWSDAVKLGNESRPKFSSYELNEGDIVLSLDRPLVSNGLKVAKLQANDVPSLLLQRVGRFLLNDEIDLNYLYTFLNSENFINEIKGHDQSLGVPHISPSQVENIEIPIPPTIEEQRKLTERISEQMQAAETLKKSLTEKLEAVKKLPAALLRKAFAGEI